MTEPLRCEIGEEPTKPLFALVQLRKLARYAAELKRLGSPWADEARARVEYALERLLSPGIRRLIVGRTRRSGVTELQIEPWGGQESYGWECRGWGMVLFTNQGTSRGRQAIADRREAALVLMFLTTLDEHYRSGREEDR